MKNIKQCWRVSGRRLREDRARASAQATSTGQKHDKSLSLSLSVYIYIYKWYMYVYMYIYIYMLMMYSDIYIYIYTHYVNRTEARTLFNPRTRVVWRWRNGIGIGWLGHGIGEMVWHWRNGTGLGRLGQRQQTGGCLVWDAPCYDWHLLVTTYPNNDNNTSNNTN